MWRQIAEILTTKLHEKISEIDAHVESAVDAAIHAQGRNESRYDTYKEDFSREAAAADNIRNAYAAALLEIETLMKNGQGKSETVTAGCLARLKYQSGNERLYFLVSEAAGGLEAETPMGIITLVSTYSLLGGQLLGKTLGAKISINSHLIEITEIQQEGDNHEAEDKT